MSERPERSQPDKKSNICQVYKNGSAVEVIGIPLEDGKILVLSIGGETTFVLASRFALIKTNETPESSKEKYIQRVADLVKAGKQMKQIRSLIRDDKYPPKL